MTKPAKFHPMLIASVLIVLLWITGVFQIVAGVIAGTMVVLALMMTIERIPGFWAFACTGIGTIVVLFGTAWLTHAVLGADTIIGMIALCWSLIFKVMVLDHKRRERRGLSTGHAKGVKTPRVLTITPTSVR